ncbi:dnaJ-like protein subfamily B member 4-like [Gossypium australe]|uniref:DnaJ-like protein subfamily B member 4-like n=1 Tax=Gossypium australe TaxID=47621 RepID=A0A5B6W525_9ROSI|nr:dnaJ-like protein subfamily B member 4-like [Gossypium australe]
MVNHLNQEPVPIFNQKKKGFSLREITRVLRSWRFRLKKSSSSDQPISQPSQGSPDENGNGQKILRVSSWTSDSEGSRSEGRSSKGFFKYRSMDACFSRQDSTNSKGASKRSRSPSPKPSSQNKEGSLRRSTTTDRNGLFETLSGSTSRPNGNPIMFSNSTGVVKPPPIEKQLECTLEDLCYGCTEKIKIKRDVITESGQRVEHKEMLSINVEPGWKKGTKITFEGMGNEVPRLYAADVTFVIAEKQHPIFGRDGDDLELTIEIPLVKALTGCSLPIPLLGGEKMELKIDEIIHPGYEKIITGQGMPTTKEAASRGNLKVRFLINFPTELTDEQRAAAVRILGDSSS